MENAINGPPLEVVVWGKMACFTRPEAKAERVSYPVMTPSAARGVLEAIFWKPEFRYRVREIAALRPVRYVSLLRNEVNLKASPQSDGISITDERTQRHTLALLNAAYHIRADIVLRPDVTDDPAKYRDQFRRRVAKGQCFHRPYLGCREFAADFALPDDLPPELAGSAPWRGLPEELGLMLFDIAFAGPGTGGVNVPLFFEAKSERGVLRVPDEQYEMLASLSGSWTASASAGEAAAARKTQSRTALTFEGQEEAAP